LVIGTGTEHLKELAVVTLGKSKLGDGPPAIHIFKTPLDYYTEVTISWLLKTKPFEFTKVF
jgi:hypothetical protein